MTPGSPDTPEIEPLRLGPALSCWFSDFDGLERAHAAIERTRYGLTGSATYLSRVDTSLNLGFSVTVPPQELHCCHPRRIVVATCRDIAVDHAGRVEAREDCQPFWSDWMPHRYRRNDADALVDLELRERSGRVAPGQDALLGTSEVFDARALDLPPADSVTVIAHRAWTRFLLTDRECARTSGALVVDITGNVRHVPRHLGEAVAIGGWEGVFTNVGQALLRKIYEGAEGGHLRVVS